MEAIIYIFLQEIKYDVYKPRITMSRRKLTNYGLATATTVLSTPSLFTFFSHERRDIL